MTNFKMLWEFNANNLTYKNTISGEICPQEKADKHIKNQRYTRFLKLKQWWCEHEKSCQRIGRVRRIGLFIADVTSYEQDLKCMKCGKQFTTVFDSWF